MSLVKKVEDGAVTQLLLNREEKRNALSLALMEELLIHFKTLSESTRIVILEGVGFFCSGLDLDEVSQDRIKSMRILSDVFYTLATLPAITIAKIRGGAYAGGLGLVASCDLAYATEEAQFCLPELKRGIVPALVFTLLKALSPKALNELIFTAEPINASSAKAIGLINQILPDLNLEPIIDQILKTDFLAAKLYKKQCQRESLKQELERALEVHSLM